ncbi:hypothetical protein DFJ74DRAFT_711722 [Hyaloraphidium curvatum]|nr:hypothetical protein DFJ74DRAFT_711722 [Hyaloraphidium curvatum]
MDEGHKEEPGGPPAGPTAADWMAVLPLPPAPPQKRFARPSPADPAAALRAERPLTLETLLADLRRFSSSLALAVRIQLLIGPWARRVVLRAMVGTVLAGALSAVPFVFGGGAVFALPQMVVGTVALNLFALAMWGITALAVYRAAFAAASGAPAASAPRDFSALGVAGLARWIEALGPSNQPSVLLEHDAKDPPGMCPCAEPSCSGKLPARAAALRWLEIVSKTALLLVFQTFVLWTPLASPVYAATTWTTPWSIVLGCLAVLGALSFSIPISLGRFTTNLALLQLAHRVDRRAVQLALTDLLDRYHAAATGTAPWHPRAPEPYTTTHALLLSAWNRRLSTFNSSVSFIFGLAAAAIAAAANAIAGGCIPAVYIAYWAYAGVINLFDLVNVAAANAQVSDIGELYADAARELAETHRDAAAAGAAADTSPARTAADPALLVAMRADAAVLATYEDVDRFRTRFLGFVVTYGAVRTIVVTAVTLAVALYSVVRGLGVFVTLETMCPTR